MSNRTLLYLTALVLVGMGVLLVLNMTAILTDKSEEETYLKYNQVRGIAVVHNKALYTLNFKQQNDVIAILNQSIRVMGVKPGKRQKPSVEKMIIYRFHDEPDITIMPIAYVDNQLVFSVPQWNPDGYLMEVSDGRLQQLLSQTYDP